MKKLTSILVGVLYLALTSGYAQAAYLLVNVWDGAEISIVRKMYQENRLPNLKALGQLGQLTSVIPCYEKRCQEGVTRDQHATLLTGLDAGKHKIWGNGSLNAIPSGLTLYEKLRNRIPGIKLAQIGKCELFGRNANKRTPILF